MKLDAWYFTLNIDPHKDAHTALVNWLAKSNISHIFTEKNKQVGYYVSFDENGAVLKGRSSIQIEGEGVYYKNTEINADSEVSFIVRVNATRIKRPPRLKHEIPTTSSRTKVTYTYCGEAEIQKRVRDILIECGIDQSSVTTSTFEPSQVIVFHKKQNLHQLRYYVDVVVTGRIIKPDSFLAAWQKGVGSKKVYGFGCIRSVRNTVKGDLHAFS